MILRLAGIAVSVGLADSINPSTVGPGLYLSTGRRPVERVLLFAAGVVAVDLVGGIALALGPGRLLVALLPHPRAHVRHAIELAAGLVLLGVAVALWLGRRRLARRELPMRSGGGASALVAGATIAAVELPTALPYFAVIAATVASPASVVESVVILALYSVAFVVPLLAIAAVLVVAGPRAEPRLQAAGAWLQRRWPLVLAVFLLVVGAALSALGAFGLLAG